MKKLCTILSIIMLSICPAYCEESILLTGSVSMVPQSFFGTWRVVSKLVDTDSDKTFKKKGLDLWNLSRTNNVITLCNPFNGAKAEITVKRVDSKYIEFYKIGNYDHKVLKDKVEISLDGDKFIGFDTLILETHVNGKIIKTETAKYSLEGEKIAGQIEE